MKEWKQAFKLSLPIFFGYLFLGIAFAILMVQDGYSGWWAIFSSIFMYAGSMQFCYCQLYECWIRARNDCYYDITY